METSKLKEVSLELEYYVSAFCSSPRPSRFEEMSLVKKLINEDKIPLLKTVVVKVDQISDTRKRSPVFQKLAEKFGVFPNSREEDVKLKVEISITKQETPVTQKGMKPDIVTTYDVSVEHGTKPNIVNNLVENDLDSHVSASSFLLKRETEEVCSKSLLPPLLSSVYSGQPSLIHHEKVASNIKSEYEQELPVVSVKVENDDQCLIPDEPVVPLGDPLTSDVDTRQRNSVVVPNPNISFVPHFTTVSSLSEISSTPNSCYVSSWKLSPPPSPEISSPSPLASKLLSLHSTLPRSSPHVFNNDSNQMLLVDPVTFLPLHEKSTLSKRDGRGVAKVHLDDWNTKSPSSLMESMKQSQERKFKMKHKLTEHWIVGVPTQHKQPDICEICLKSFESEIAVGCHKRQAHAFAPNPLNTMMAKDRIKNVITQVKSVLFACAQCERKCKSKKSLGKHISRAHNIKSTVPCPENCGKMLTTTAAIKKHLLSHRPPSEWPVSCPLCHKRFQARADIPKHLLTAKHKYDNLPEVGSEGWWALVCWDRPELIPKWRKRKQGR